jgi:formyl-CoA transferase
MSAKSEKMMSDEHMDLSLPLSGVRVIDFTQVYLGPAATQLLGDFGADVIKIEPIERGDLSRTFVDQGNDLENNPVYLSTNRNKRSLAIDLKTDEARKIVYELVKTADVVASNFRPKVMTRLGLDYETLKALNPRLIYARASGYGPTGPYEHKGGQDAIAQAMSGFMERRADPSLPISINPTSVCDYSAGMHLAQGVLLALIGRARTGRGQIVDVSLYDSMLHMQMIEAACIMTGGFEMNWASRPLTGAFKTFDGMIVIVGGFRKNPLHHLSLALGVEDLTSLYPTRALQAHNRSAIQQIIREKLVTNTSAHWIARLEEQDILCAPVQTLSEALEDEQTSVNDMIWSKSASEERSVKVVGSPIHMSEMPTTIRRFPPRLGENTEEILSEMGYSGNRIEALRAKGVVA